MDQWKRYKDQIVFFFEDQLLKSNCITFTCKVCHCTTILPTQPKRWPPPPQPSLLLLYRRPWERNSTNWKREEHDEIHHFLLWILTVCSKITKMCYIGKATKIFIFLITVLVITGLVLGFSVLRRSLHLKSHKCSGESCSQSDFYPPPPLEFPLPSTPDPNASNSSDPLSNPPPPPTPSLSGSGTNPSPPPPAASLASPPSESSSIQTASPPPPPVSVLKTSPPPPRPVVLAPPPAFSPPSPVPVNNL